MLAPSDFAKGHNQTAWDPLLLNHRPTDAEGLPTELLHPVFGRFRDNLVSVKPQTQDIQLSLELMDVMSKRYASDELRLEAFRYAFQGQYGFKFGGISFNHRKADATAIQGQFFIANVEGAGDDPSLQNAAYYGKRLLETEAARESRLPMFLVDVVVRICLQHDATFANQPFNIPFCLAGVNSMHISCNTGNQGHDRPSGYHQPCKFKA